MKPRATFKQISRLLMDSWISGPDGLGSPEDIYAAVLGMLRPSMILLVVDTGSRSTPDFRIDIIKNYSLPSGFADIGLLEQSQSFADFPDQKYLHEIMAPAYITAVERQRPSIGNVVARILGMHAAYQRIVLPQKNSLGWSTWCIGLVDVHFLLPAGSRAEGTDDVDLGIVQLLGEGASIREIAEAVSLSPRTVEHRIERLKSAFGARNIAHLLAMWISAGIAGVGKRDE
ncbi:response regulator protein [Rhizobium sp. N6212]|uniref:response regulator transcription factor n=2 Tax=Rhizobium/Agrobacterium group TaxID=227290 RepID=UPI0007EA0F95|nr:MULTISPECIES: helix-turn-helix transcriptional regulator [unclassified Rhizobium]ANK92734.1 response regulator protein [Rhizobium sp. N6212]ANK98779.1 response regulator protein [Rhizobium sp. N621]ANL04907.1 response regulator protein [Rhizobium esperanzae]ANL10966.1 response regulator protein [Rhizobium sp. N1341]ANM35749.1 response regulator protein [Rhizobium sp. N871]